MPRVVSAVVTTYFACNVLFGVVHFVLRRRRRQTGYSWQDGFTQTLGATHLVVFAVASLQYVVRSFMVPRYILDKDETSDRDPWDPRILLLYYEACVLSFFVILTTAGVYLWKHPPLQQEQCDETVDGSTDGDQDGNTV